MSDALIGYGSVFQVESTDLPGVFVSLEEVFSINPPSFTVDQIDITHWQSPDHRREFASGRINPGECSIEMNFVPGSTSDILLNEIVEERVPWVCRIVFPNGRFASFRANLVSYETAVSNDDKMTATLNWKVTGKVSFSLGAETVAYVAAIEAAGGTLDNATALAVDSFVNAGKSEGWWNKILDASMGVGSNLAASLVKIVVAPGTPTSYANTGFLGGDYTQAGGLVSDGSGKFLGTGVNPTSQSMSITSMGQAVEAVSLLGTSFGGMLSDNPPSILDQAVLGFGGAEIGTPGNYCEHATNAGIVRITSLGTNLHARIENVLMLSGQPSGVALPTTEITIFKGTLFATVYYDSGNLGASFTFNDDLTEAESKAFSLSLLSFNRAIRTQSALARALFFGDSITFGQGATNPHTTGWAAQVATDQNWRKINLSSPSRFLRNPADAKTHIIGQYQDGPDIGDIEYVVVMAGTNDSIFGGATPPATYETDLQSICEFYQTTHGIQMVLCSIPWLSIHSNALWRDAAQNAAAAVPGTIFVDIYQAFVDTGAPATFFVDGTHPNQAGHDLIAAEVISAL